MEMASTEAHTSSLSRIGPDESNFCPGPGVPVGCGGCGSACFGSLVELLGRGLGTSMGVVRSYVGTKRIPM
ncbi:hypothetical protein [Streptomyces spectabilis]|uniref:Uncharacterized protein n=1 Tax=Streptomyces spectabilis TaxID=68270 RepID=A0A516R1H5_STRST|nr:hypothetical protein [Streptomyces spectabilis]QDQ09502.1 hypothetical protein FH965_02125 [Streptomyces spectabilis]